MPDRPALEEKVAEAIAREDGLDPDDRVVWRRMARAALAVIDQERDGELKRLRDDLEAAKRRLADCEVERGERKRCALAHQNDETGA